MIDSLAKQAAAQLIAKAKTVAQRQEASKQYRITCVTPAVKESLTENFDVEKFIREVKENKVFGIKPYNAKTGVNSNVAERLVGDFLVKNKADVAALVEAIALGNVGKELAINYNF